LQAAPELVVEILSPDDRWRDVQDKLREYFAVGVERVWLVDPERRKVEVYRSFTEMRQLGEADTLMGEGALDGFALPVASLFEE
jgi:Uma2 family endonuclease